VRRNRRAVAFSISAVFAGVPRPSGEESGIGIAPALAITEQHHVEDLPAAITSFIASRTLTTDHTGFADRAGLHHGCRPLADTQAPDIQGGVS
jgi:hypothetical protein